tara:strand:- start:196 stop:444 length:249 start_codon:yes stop_codon:yes gene_type:complete
MRSLASIVMKEIENQIIDKVVPVIELCSEVCGEVIKSILRSDLRSDLRSIDKRDTAQVLKRSTLDIDKEVRAILIQEENGFV